jgi:hypothetical protein
VHSYEPHREPDGTRGPDQTDDLTEIGPFTGPEDLVAFMARDDSVSQDPRPYIYHLDANGRFCCGHYDSRWANVRGWAEYPTSLYLPQLIEPRASCPNRWLVVESRPTRKRRPCVVNEADAQAFVVLRTAVAEEVGLDLIDVMIFDDKYHWWSLHELTTGQTAWTPPKQLSGWERPRSGGWRPSELSGEEF